jgi:hypothetical protein
LLSYADAEWNEDMPTPGSWLYLDFKDYGSPKGKDNFFGPTDLGTVSMAYHGTSISCGALILSEGFRRGPHVTGNRKGIYMGAHRKLQVLNYVTHESAMTRRAHPLQQFGVVFELLADRSRGRTIHSQWVQPLKTFQIDGMYLHCFDPFSLYLQNYMGWFRCHVPTLEHLATTAAKEELRSSWQLQDELYEEHKRKKKAQARAHVDDAEDRGPPARPRDEQFQ